MISHTTLKQNLLVLISIVYIMTALSTGITSIFFGKILGELLPALFFSMFLVLFYFRYSYLISISRQYFFLAYFFLLYLFFLSLLLNGDEILRLIYMAKYLVIVAVFLPKYGAILDERISLIIIKFIVVVSAVYSVFSIGTIYFEIEDFGFAQQFNRGRGGQRGTLNYSTAMAIVLPLTVFFLDNKVKFFILSFLIIAGIASSGSRAAFISVVIFLALSKGVIINNILPKHMSRYRKKIYTYTVILLLFLLVVGLALSSDRLLMLHFETSGGDTNRLENYLSYFQLRENLIIGNGVGVTAIGMSHFDGYAVEGFESYFLNFLHEGGVFAAIIILLIILRVRAAYRDNIVLRNFVIPQVPIILLQITYENFSVLTILCFVYLLLIITPKDFLPRKNFNKIKEIHEC